MDISKNIKNLPEGITYNHAAGFVADTKKFQERILTLNKSQLRHFGPSNYKKNGFYVGVVKGEEERKQIDIVQDLMEREEFKARDSYEPVFNTFISNDKRMKEMSKENSNVKIDGGRNMIHISKTKEEQLVNHSNIVGNIMRKQISSDLDLTSLLSERKSTRSEASKGILPMILTLLETEAAVSDDEGRKHIVPDQLIHCDVDSDDKSLDRLESYIGILATQKEVFTELRVIPHSHLLKDKRSKTTYKMPKFIYRVQLPQYYYFVGHPFLLHSGCGSVLRNTRFHFYHGLSRKSQSSTVFVDFELTCVKAEMKKVRATTAETSQTMVKKRKLHLLPSVGWGALKF